MPLSKKGKSSNDQIWGIWWKVLENGEKMSNYYTMGHW